MVDWNALLQTYGPAAPIVAGVIWAYLQERKERISAQQNERETLREVLTAVPVLEAAVKALEKR